ncbi:MAG: toxin-antitoxin system HicB family antitoxin [Bacteroidetes bacterium]|nr:toxin-antitoxin system HicB family antitoxin [Bacteroidota bacterium]
MKHYLCVCKAEGVEPNKPMSGVLNVRTTPEYHYKLSVISKREKQSLNKIVNEAIQFFIAEKGVRVEGK